ncbi:hypothetical protein [Ferrimonas sediminicola]|nr:hypothetical protein [Ferrimonas sediminicola]
MTKSGRPKESGPKGGPKEYANHPGHGPGGSWPSKSGHPNSGGKGSRGK